MAKGRSQSTRPYPPILTDLRDLEPGQPQWVWPGWIPRSHTSLLTGDPDAGKTYAILSLVTAYTQGAPFPDGSIAPPGKVLYLDAENGLEELKRRLAGQGMVAWERIRVLSEVAQVDQRGIPLNLERHLASFCEAITTFEPDWVIIDPLVAFHRSNEISATEVRGLLRTLAQVATEYNVAITFLQHPNKNAKAPDLYRVRGSLDFIAAVRSVLRVSVKDDGQRVLAVDKLNLAPKPKPQGFLIGDGAQVQWTGEIDESQKKSKFDAAREFLERLLGEGPAEAVYVQEAARAEGISWRTVQRARAHLPIEVQKSSADGLWVWQLSAASDWSLEGVDEVVL